MRILLTGKNGQKGFELRRALAPLGPRRVYQFFRVPWSSPRGSLQGRINFVLRNKELHCVYKIASIRHSRHVRRLPECGFGWRWPAFLVG